MRDDLLAPMIEEAQRLSALLDAGLKALREASRDYAQAEHDYRRARATALLESPSGTVAEREASADLHSADQRLARDTADGMRTAALEAVRSRRQQLSALQSLLAAHREEAAYGRTAGDR
jgi:hypothetical protein